MPTLNARHLRAHCLDNPDTTNVASEDHIDATP